MKQVEMDKEQIDMNKEMLKQATNRWKLQKTGSRLWITLTKIDVKNTGPVLPGTHLAAQFGVFSQFSFIVSKANFRKFEPFAIPKIPLNTRYGKPVISNILFQLVSTILPLFISNDLPPPQDTKLFCRIVWYFLILERI